MTNPVSVPRELLAKWLVHVEARERQYDEIYTEGDELRALLAAPVAAPSQDDVRDAERYRWLIKQTPHRFRKIQESATTDGGDVFYFHRGMSEIERYAGLDGREYVPAPDHDAKVAALEAACAALAAGACDGVVGDDYGNAYCKYKAELAALKGAAGEEPEVAGYRSRLIDPPENNPVWKLAYLAEHPSKPCIEEEPLMAIAQHHRIVAAMARDAEGLVEALEDARMFIRNGIELGFIRMPDADTPDPAHETLPKIDAALAAHRAGKEKPEQPPANCRQRLIAEGKPYPRSSCEACGKFSPKWKECDAALSRQPNHDAPL